MYAAFVFSVVLSEEGDLVVQQYEHDTRPENLNSLHTFIAHDAVMTFFDEMIRPLMRKDVSPQATCALLERIAEGLRQSPPFAHDPSVDVQQAIMQAVINIENARSMLLPLFTAEPEIAPPPPVTVR